jgi:hypothetical protein
MMIMTLALALSTTGAVHIQTIFRGIHIGVVQQ